MVRGHIFCMQLQAELFAYSVLGNMKLCFIGTLCFVRYVKLKDCFSLQRVHV